MNTRRTVKIRGGAAVAVLAALALTVAGCSTGSDDKPKAKESPKASTPQGDGTAAPTTSNSPKPAPTEILGTVNGEGGVVLTVNSAVRDAGGFLTVSGQLKNTSAQPFTSVAAWRGNELNNNSGASVAGVTLVDKGAKKRYYVLRDTEGRCLCTTGLTMIDAGQSVPFFAQFPAPPASTTEVDFTLPTFATATVKLSG
ncbi:hypothetical protein [Streptomyces sp. NBC_00503]|uniref:hypothetical protein n=1 Tax=Streptomyces sp. NBC_00503 TaxID=2903659 RepID=UPI002E81043C|nr:hypothetical protein [Streptomyces sp. NBC_00503]WUD83326.1 hypothetical protein OG490_23765 [Streptomyces sp. NBC_00503]